MADWSELYVDPSINADSGTGTVGDPYGDLEYCLEEEDWDASGIRVNIKRGTAEILAADITTAMADTSSVNKSVAWVPSGAAPLIFSGYDTVAGDLDTTPLMAEIDGNNGGYSIYNGSTFDWVHFKNLLMHNTGSAVILNCDQYCMVQNCELHTSTLAAINAGNDTIIQNSYIHNIDGYAVNAVGRSGGVLNCIFRNGASNKFANTIQVSSQVRNNLLILDGDSDGISCSDVTVIYNNAIWSNGGTGTGIFASSGAAPQAVMNNIIAGFSGAGGIGILLNGTDQVKNYGGNRAYDCTTPFSVSMDIVTDHGGNETLTVDPFRDAANDDFRPVANAGSIREGALPRRIGP